MNWNIFIFDFFGAFVFWLSDRSLFFLISEEKESHHHCEILQFVLQHR